MARLKRIVWAPSAYEDLKEAFEHIRQDSPVRAANWVENILSQIEKLARFPRLGRIIPEIGFSRYRELIVGEYRIFHEVTTHQLIVFRVFHSKKLFYL